MPSIDLMDGRAVQLVGGKAFELDAGDPRPLAEKFGRVGEIAVVDLDAALGRGDNRAVIEELLELAPCRVGGGIRSVEKARAWLDAGATRVVLGTAAVPEVLRELPRDRVIAALDADQGEVVVEGWQKRTGTTIADRLEALQEYVGGVLVTFVEREGRQQGTNLDAVQALRDAAPDVDLTIAGGITTCEEIATLDRLGAASQVGMALYKGTLSLGDAFTAPLVSDRPDGLFPTVVTDVQGVALGLAYSSRETLSEVIETGRGIYHSRRRGRWEKGATSGATQRVLRVDVDCDRDALRFTVQQDGVGFCHRETATCWGAKRGLAALGEKLTARDHGAVSGSYTQRLLDDAGLLRSKLREEAGELADATDGQHVAEEAADLAYFATVALRRAGKTWSDVDAVLDRRALRVSRRRGDAKIDREDG